MKKISTLLWLAATSWFSSAQAQTTLGNALDFDGTNDYVTAPANPAYELSSGTFECWVKPNGFSVQTPNSVIFGNRQGTTTRYSFHMSPTLIGLWNGSAFTTIPYTATIGQWVHLAFVCTPGNIAVYINGTYYNKISSNLGTATGLPFNIGASEPNGTAEMFNGSIDEMRVWNTVRTAAQIRDNMYYSLRGNETGLAGLFSFNQGIPGGINVGINTATDGSATKNNAVLYNFAFVGTNSNWIGNMAPVPTRVNAFSPASGNVGTTVTITGSGFDATPGNNVVMFGATQATVTAATTTSLTVTVPAGASYEPIAVTNIVKGQSASSPTAFLPTFRGTTFALSGRTDYLTGDNPVAVLVKDVNGDGRPELMSADMVGADLRIFQNTSNATVSFANPISAQVSYSPTYGIASADVNGDGKPDVVTGASGGFLVQPNTSGATPSFGAASFFAAGGDDVSDVAVADLDGDGRQDVVVADQYANAVWLYRNTGTGSTINFAAKQLLENISGVQRVAISDLDGDGKPDVLATAYNILLRVYRNTSTMGTLAFSFSGTVPSSLSAFPVAISDINADGRPDILFSPIGSSFVSVALNNGNLSFAAPQTFSAGTGIGAIATGDLNGDGKPDVVTVNSNSLSVLLNTSTGGTLSFAGKQDFATLSNPSSITIADMNNDSRPDIAVAYQFDSYLSVYQNLTGFNTLPVKLSAFNAQKQNSTVKLTWRTATENNSRSFEMERSADGQNFVTIGTVAAAGSSASAIGYGFDDVHPLARNYYRLKQNDQDGGAAYSNILLVEMGKTAATVNLMPQPVTAYLTVTVSNGEANSSVQLFNMNGNKVRSAAIGADGSIRLERESLPAGVYVYRLVNAAGDVLAKGKVVLQ